MAHPKGKSNRTCEVCKVRFHVTPNRSPRPIRTCSPRCRGIRKKQLVEKRTSKFLKIKTMVCNKCNKRKLKTKFSKCADNWHGLMYFCRKCMRKWALDVYYNDPRRRKLSKEWRDNNPRKIFGYRLKNKFGITLSQYESIFDTQKRCCGICESQTPNSKHDWNVDHCHKTGKVRGILCHACNNGIGRFNDNIDVIKKAIKYLRKYKWNIQCT